MKGEVIHISATSENHINAMDMNSDYGDGLSGLYQLRFCCLGNIGGRGTACSPVTDLQAVLF